MFDSDEKREPEEREILSTNIPLEWERIRRVEPNGHSVAPIGDRRHSVIFPPINHENLHISNFTSTSTSLTFSTHEDLRISSKTSCDRNRDAPPSPPPNRGSPSIPASDTAKFFGLGLELLRSKFTRLVSSFQGFATGRKIFTPFPTPACTVVGVMLLAALYVRFRRRRRHPIREKSVGDLVRIIEERDEKLDKLFQQIAQMNEILTAIHKGRTFKTG